MNTVSMLILADTEPVLDGLQAPWPISLLEFLRLFVAIPVAFVLLVVLLVYGASWTRSGRTSADYAQSPLWLSSPAAQTQTPNGPGISVEAAKASVAVEDKPGGSSVRW